MNYSYQKQTVCQYFLNGGNCKFGDRCNKSHDVSRINNPKLVQNMSRRVVDKTSVPFKKQKDNLLSNETYKKNIPVQSNPLWEKNHLKNQNPKTTHLKNKNEEEKTQIKQVLCDNFRKGQCTLSQCKFLHQYSLSDNLNLIGSELLARSDKEKSIALVEIEFPVFAIGFTRRILIFDAQNSSENLEIPIDGNLSCLRVIGRLIVAGYSDANRKGRLLIIPIQKGFEAKIDIPDCHQSDITSISLFDGKILTASLDGYIKLWSEDKEKNQIVAVAYGMATAGISTIMNFEETNGEVYVVAGCVDGTIQFFEWIKEKTGFVPQFNRLSTMQAHKSTIMSIITSNGLLYAGGLDSSICIISMASAKNPTIVTYQKTNGQISAMKTYKKSKNIFIGYSTGLVQICKAEGLKEETWFTLHKAPILDILCLEDKNLFFVLDYNGYISTWKYEDKESVMPNSVITLPTEIKGLSMMDQPSNIMQ